ncbi:MAG: PEP-CTERM sorting domain-containing protein [Planctomycetota bacterium]
MKSGLFRACLAAAVAILGFLCLDSRATAAVVHYTYDGGTGTYTGSYGSYSFTNATWVIKASTDSSMVQYIPPDPADPNSQPYYIGLVNSITLTLNDSTNGTQDILLTPVTSGINTYNWLVASIQSSGTIDGAIGFFLPGESTSYATIGYATPGIPVWYTPGAFNNLTTSGSWRLLYNIGLVAGTYATETDPLVITAKQDGATFATFTIVGADTAVPEPSTVVIFGLGILGLALHVRAQRKSAGTC